MSSPFKRVAKSAGGADPSGLIFGMNLGIHYEKDTFGSRTGNAK